MNQEEITIPSYTDEMKRNVEKIVGTYTDKLGNVFNTIKLREPVEGQRTPTIVNTMIPKKYLTKTIITYGINRSILDYINTSLPQMIDDKRDLENKKYLLQGQIEINQGNHELIERKILQIDEALAKIESSKEMFLRKKQELEDANIILEQIINDDYERANRAVSLDYNENFVNKITAEFLTTTDIRSEIKYKVTYANSRKDPTTLIESVIYALPNNVNIDDKQIFNTIKIIENPNRTKSYQPTANMNNYRKYDMMEYHYNKLLEKYEKRKNLYGQRFPEWFKRFYDKDIQKMIELKNKYKTLKDNLEEAAANDYDRLDAEDLERQFKKALLAQQKADRLREEEENKRKKSERDLKSLAENEQKTQTKGQKKKGRTISGGAGAGAGAAEISDGGAASSDADVREKQRKKIIRRNYADTLNLLLGNYITLDNQIQRNTCDIRYYNDNTTDRTDWTGYMRKMQSLPTDIRHKIERLKSRKCGQFQDYSSTNLQNEEDLQNFIQKIRVCIYGRIIEQLMYPCYNLKEFVNELLQKESNFTIETFELFKNQYIHLDFDYGFTTNVNSTDEEKLESYIRHLNVLYQLHSLLFLLKHLKPGVRIIGLQFIDYDVARPLDEYNPIVFDEDPKKVYFTFLQRCMILLYERTFELTLEDSSNRVTMRVTPSPQTGHAYINNLKTFFTHISDFDTLKQEFPEDETLQGISDLLFHNYSIKHDYYTRSDTLWTTMFQQFNQENDNDPQDTITKLILKSGNNIYHFASPTVFIWFEGIESQKEMYNLYTKGEISENFYNFYREVNSYPPNYEATFLE